MLFYITALTFLLLGGLLVEGILTLFLRYKLKNNSLYTRIFLLSDGKRTLEDYILKIFFPRYFIWLLFCFSIILVNHAYYTEYMLQLSSILSSLLLIVRAFNRNIFSSIWEVLGKHA